MHEDIKFMLIGTEVSEDDYEDNLSKFLDKYVNLNNLIYTIILKE